MLRSLKEVQADDSVVGFYQAMTLGSFYNQSLIETQAIQQEKLRHGGIVVVHGGYLPPYTVGSSNNLGRCDRCITDGTRECRVPRFPPYEKLP